MEDSVEDIKQRLVTRGKMLEKVLFVSVIGLLSVSGLPVTLNSSLSSNDGLSSDSLAEEGDYFEGDIILRPEQLEYLKQNSEQAENGVKTLIADPTAIWPDRTVYYDFAPQEFSLAEQNIVFHALNDLMVVSCVRFSRRTTQPTYILLRNNARGCAAAVGYHNFGPLELFLGGPTCHTRGTIQHEFLHTLGFWHEHTRQDRDKHIIINWNSIIPGKEFNFYKRDPTEIMNLEMPYDYGSVMHYRAIAFSSNLVSPTITPLVPQAATRMGQRVRFSTVDLAKLNRLYNCPLGYYRGDDLRGKSSVVGDTDIKSLNDKFTKRNLGMEPENLEETVQEHGGKKDTESVGYK